MPSLHTPNSSEDSALLEAYFAAREASEINLLSAGRSWDLQQSLEVLRVQAGSINDQEIVDRLISHGIDHCLVFGCSWLKAPWLQAFPGRMFNLHLGLSPYYRGAATNFWPLHDGLPEYVGATVHRIDAGIDTGPILFHVRPDPVEGDDSHSLGNKTIAKSVKALRGQLERLTTVGAVRQLPGIHNGRTFRTSDFNASTLRIMLARLASGMMASYVGDLVGRASRVDLVEEYQPIGRRR
ncbi:formyltransferase family protein [Rhizobium paknamense]